MRHVYKKLVDANVNHTPSSIDDAVTVLKYLAIGAGLSVTTLVALALVFAYPYDSTIKARLFRAGPENVVREADELCAMCPPSHGDSATVPADKWPPSVKTLKPSDVYVREEGVYIKCDGFFVGEEGIFILAPGSSFVPPGRESDPAYEKLADRVFFYSIKG